MRLVAPSLLAVIVVPALLLGQERSPAAACGKDSLIHETGSGSRATGIDEFSPRVRMLYTYTSRDGHARVDQVVLIHRPGGWPIDSSAAAKQHEQLDIPTAPKIPGHCRHHPWAALEGLVVQFGVGEGLVWADRQEVVLGDGNVAALEWPGATGQPFSVAHTGSVPADIKCGSPDCRDANTAIKQALERSATFQAFVRQ